MEHSASPQRGSGPRHSILDLAPLELECMSVLWPLGEGTVRDIHRQLAVSRPRAYTTIMTIMDRLAHKGIVTRHRVGRAYRYQPNLSADEARVSAIEKIVTGFFDGSAEALAAHLAVAGGTARPGVPAPERLGPPRHEPRLIVNELNPERFSENQPHRERPEPSTHAPVDRTNTPGKESVIQRLDETLL
jgi:BlaI family transcriptional regulator, penicillinase repressor